MKSLVGSLLVFSKLVLSSSAYAGNSSYAGMDLPILGEYQLHQRLEGGCFGISPSSKFRIGYSEGIHTFSLARVGAPRDDDQGFHRPSDPGETFFSTPQGFGVHRSEPTDVGYVHVETLTPFNEGRGLHASYVITFPGNGERNVIVDGTFEIEGDLLYASFRKTRSYGQHDAGKCILKRRPAL